MSYLTGDGGIDLIREKIRCAVIVPYCKTRWTTVFLWVKQYEKSELGCSLFNYEILQTLLKEFTFWSN